MKHRMYTRLFFSIAAIVFAGLLLFAGTGAYVLSSQKENERIEELRNEAISIANVLQQVEKGPQYSDEIKRIATAFSNTNEASVFFVNRSGLITVCSDSINQQPCSHEGNTLDSETVYSVFVQGRYEANGTLGSLYDSNYYTVGVPIVNTDEWFESAVFVSSKAETRFSCFLEVLKMCWAPFFISLALCSVAVYWISRKTMQPIREISEATKAMANGDFSGRVRVNRRDEIGELAQHFNTMAQTLSELDSMSGSFVTNVSHDLKTPMTTISGFIDGILDGTIPQKEHRRYLSVVSQEVKRLSGTVNTMLSLSRIQSGMTSMTFHPVDVTDVMMRVVFSFEQTIEEKHLDVLGLDAMGTVVLDGDENLLFQAFYNLIDNAVKFVQPNGYISFSAQENNSDWELYIKNSGDGIPENDIRHVFERFYKSDKSRSMDKNGSGVGLYIVKTIIDNHNGDIVVKSVEGQYTQMCIRLPKSHK